MPLVRCPQCSKQMDATGLPPGSLMSCPHCNARLRSPGGAPPQPKRRPPPMAEVLDDEEDEAERRPRKRKRKSESVPVGLILGVCGAFIAVGGILWFVGSLLSGNGDRKVVVADGGKTDLNQKPEARKEPESSAPARKEPESSAPARKPESTPPKKEVPSGTPSKGGYERFLLSEADCDLLIECNPQAIARQIPASLFAEQLPPGLNPEDFDFLVVAFPREKQQTSFLVAHRADGADVPLKSLGSPAQKDEIEGFPLYEEQSAGPRRMKFVLPAPGIVIAANDEAFLRTRLRSRTSAERRNQTSGLHVAANVPGIMEQARRSGTILGQTIQNAPPWLSDILQGVLDIEIDSSSNLKLSLSATTQSADQAAKLRDLAKTGLALVRANEAMMSQRLPKQQAEVLRPIFERIVNAELTTEGASVSYRATLDSAMVKGFVTVVLPAAQAGRAAAQAAMSKRSKGESLADARKGFRTNLTKQEKENDPLPAPPPRLFRMVRYQAPIGKMAAFVGVDPKDGKKHPAMIWVSGGFSNSIDDSPWKPAPDTNDQSARAFREAKMVMMYPSFRGGSGNPGYREAFLGEVDDLLAAANYLAKQPYVDPDRIYLGGHSTGGTMALLAAASTNRFRAVVSFGPVENVAGYGLGQLPFDVSNPRELQLRAPVVWLESIKTPTYVIEGDGGNHSSLLALEKASRNPNLHFFTARGFNHFNVLGPACRLLAQRLSADDGEKADVRLDQSDFDRLSAR